MAEVTILCPSHGTEETLNLPSSYTGSSYRGDPLFEGDVPCAGGNVSKPSVILSVKIHFPREGAIWVEKLTSKS